VFTLLVLCCNFGSSFQVSRFLSGLCCLIFSVLCNALSTIVFLFVQHKWSRRVSNSCSISGTHSFTLVKNPVKSRDIGKKDWIVTVTDWTYPLSCVTQLFCNCYKPTQRWIVYHKMSLCSLTDENEAINWLPQYNWNIVESGVKHHNPYPLINWGILSSLFLQSDGNINSSHPQKEVCRSLDW
jgi:hypothetical protein